ncbi:MAG: ParB/RepB/Spo0J family partition protein [Deltaproteobacteria bacterium]|nr:ParB/RepB/Spo0J family partition protein [Deltaproteobacteria bacterium]
MSAQRPPRRAALGRGLSSLITTAETEKSDGARRVLQVGIERLAPHKEQPRRRFEDDALAELAASVKDRGVLMPILVRRHGGAFQIIAGERRWRAAQKAGLSEVPVVIEEADDAEAFEIALIENLQREDLTPIEEAEAYRRLMETGPATQAEVASLVGKKRSTVANAVRLLKLPEAVRDAVNEGRLTMGHAKVLLSADEKKLEELARKVLAEGLTVIQTQALLKAERPKADKKNGKKLTDTPATRDLVRKLEAALGCRVKLEDRGGKGQLLITYGDLDGLDRVVGKILGE